MHEPERPEETLRVRMHHGMTHDLALEKLELLLGRQGTIDEQVRGLQVRRLKGQLLDGVSSASRSAPCCIPPYVIRTCTAELLPRVSSTPHACTLQPRYDPRLRRHPPPASPSIYVISLRMTAVLRKPLSCTRRPFSVSFSSRSPGFRGAAIALNAVAEMALSAMLQCSRPAHPS